uniref:arf-GAP with coiled-coil, ANK repeat and PH domain-containing protein 1 isoform X2 n=1 Tax=Myxine glutinosa TaxID=7769 RepID=UPI00358F9BC6
MVLTVDFEECLKDSPRFRASVEEVEGDVVEMEVKLEKLVKLCGGMIEAGKAYTAANRLFVSGLRELVTHTRKDDMLAECLDKFAVGLQEIVTYYTVLFDQAHRSIKMQLQKFVKQDVRRFKETKKHFEKMSEEMEGALVRNAQASRTKPHETEEASTMLATTRKCFRHLALDYVLQINVLQTKKRLEVLDSMLSYMHAQQSFFQQGFDLLSNLDPYLKDLTAQLDQLVVDSAKEKREMEQKHGLIQQQATLQEISDDGKMDVNLDSLTGIVMEGYLYKRASNAFKTWNRRWFSIQNNQLVYQKKLKDSPTVVVEDLRLCSVKPYEDIERRFCFEVVSPVKSCILQADSEQLRQLWIKAVQASIATAYRECDDPITNRLERTSSPSTGSLDSAESRERGLRNENVVPRVQAAPGNDRCCDCGLNDPRWASINLGIVLCIECSGIHRSLGVHCSKVRSLTLDSWEPELLKLMCELGNLVINRIYEARVEEMGAKKPTASCTRQEKEAWIKAKYVDRKFLRPLGEGVLCNTGGTPLGICRDSSRGTRGTPGSRRRRRRDSIRKEPGSSPRLNPAAAVLDKQIRRDSLFCPDELDSLFSYFDNVAAAGFRSLSSDSGLGGSSDGSTDILVFDSVPEHASECSDDSSLDGGMEMEFASNGAASHIESLPEISTPPHPSLLICHAACGRKLPLMAEALAHRGDVNWSNEMDNCRTPLIYAVHGGSLVACELLLQNAAEVNLQDAGGRTPLHHATYLGHTGQVCLFLKRGANQHARDQSGMEPVTVAVQQANADIVTLLRLARMNDEMREGEGQYPINSPTEVQYRKCIQEFITLQIDEC